MAAMGSDFNYQNAIQWYHNLDVLIHHVNRNGTVRCTTAVFWSALLLGFLR